jgi:hypothetical protein
VCYYKHKDKKIKMPDLNQFLGNAESTDDIGHSSGYAGAAGGAGAGGLSMEARRKKLNQPRVVGDYQYSKLGRQSSALKAKTADPKDTSSYDASTESVVDGASYSNRQQGGIKDETQVDTKNIERSQHFIEPPTRGYDKYA